MIGPKLPPDWVPLGKRRRQELQNLRKMVDTKATAAHRNFMNEYASFDRDPQLAMYYKGYADGLSDVFHALSVMRGFPWA